MGRQYPLAIVLALALGILAQAPTPRNTALAAERSPTRRATALFPEGRQVVLVGRISSSPKHILGIREERKMQVAIGPNRIDYTLHLADASMMGANGRTLDLNDLVDGMWVYADGTVMDDPRRIHVTTLETLGRSERDYRASRFWHRGEAFGYIAAAPGAAAASNAGAHALPLFTEGTRVVVVGEISHAPGRLLDTDKMQVAVGRAKMNFTLHLRDAQLYNLFGAKVGTDDLEDRMWVRAQGTMMDDPRRIHVTKLQVIGKDLPSLRRSAFYRPGYEQGYVMAAAGSRQIYPEVRGTYFAPGPLLIVGEVSEDTGPLETTRKIRVDAAGNTWTINVPRDTPVFDGRGDKISVHEISKGQWVRVHGWQTDDLRVRAARVQEMGPEARFRQNALYRAGQPMGYVERLPGPGVRFAPVRASGVILSVDPTAGLVTVRDGNGAQQTFPTETVTIFSDGRPVGVETLRPGQSVTIQGSQILF